MHKLVQLFKYCSWVFLFTLPLGLFAQATITAVANGAWTDNSTWSPARQPTNGDRIVIPAGRTVEVASTTFFPTTPVTVGTATGTRVIIEVFGTLRFGFAANLRLPLGSIVVVYSTGLVSSDGYIFTPDRIQISNGSSYQTVWDTDQLDVDGRDGVKSITSNGVTPGNVLPVNLTSFTLSENNQKIRLQWTTASELNNSHFEIERSLDARNWQKVGSVNGNGTTINPHHYQFVDPLPFFANYFYRLKQVDFDGTITYYSPIRRVEGASPTIGYRLFPNPTTDFFSITAPSYIERFTWISIRSENGQELMRVVNVKPLQPISIQALPKGKYLVQFATNLPTRFPAMWVVKQ